MFKAFQQFKYLVHELRLMNNTRYWRWLTCWFSTSFAVIVFYRFDRFWYLMLGRLWPILRVFLAPLLFLIRPWTGNNEIHYKADIGPGLRVLHPALGVVISGKTIAGANLTLTGGNCIGIKSSSRHNYCIQLGDNINLGANAVILGPIHIGNNVNIGAGAVVVKDIESNETVVGVPALPTSKHTIPL